MKTISSTLLWSVLLLTAACEGERTPTSSPGDAADERVPSERAPPTSAAPAGTAASAGDATARAMLRLSQGSPSYLVDASGASLYFLEGNTQGTQCDSTCEQAWPPVVAGDAGAADGIEAGLVGRLERPDGRTQLTYARQPLYRYAGDAGAGRTSGHKVQDKWGQWALMAPDGKALAHTPAADNAPERESQKGDAVP